MDVDELLAFRDNSTYFGELVKALRGAGVIPFVGAGLSIPCDMPGWKSFLEDQIERSDIAGKVKRRLEDGFYEAAAQLVYDKLGAEMFNDRLQKEFGPEVVPRTQLQGAVRYVPELVKCSHSRPVITTNFDRVLEAAFRAHGHGFKEVIPGARPDAISKALGQKEHFLLKIHGDFADRKDRILTKAEYEENYGTANEKSVDVNQPLPNVLLTMLQNRPLLFLGCSLQQDRTMAVLEHIARAFSAAPHHFAIITAEETDEETNDRAIVLRENYKIRPIFYPKRTHEAVATLVAALVEKCSGWQALGFPRRLDRYAFLLSSSQDMLERDRLSLDDLKKGVAITPSQLEDVVEQLRERGHMAVEGDPGAGKSSLAAWVDYELWDKGWPVEYLPGQDYQTTPARRLVKDLRLLEDGTVAILDDVHLMRDQVASLTTTTAVKRLRLLYLGRTCVFSDLEKSDGLPEMPKPLRIEKQEGAAVARALAERFLTGHQRADLEPLLSATGGDLVYTKWMLSNVKKHGMGATKGLQEHATTYLDNLQKKAGEERGNEVLKIFLVLSGYRSVELPCPLSDLTGRYGFELGHIDYLTDNTRDATYENGTNSVRLERHPKLAGLLADAAGNLRHYNRLVLEPICKN